MICLSGSYPPTSGALLAMLMVLTCLETTSQRTVRGMAKCKLEEQSHNADLPNRTQDHGSGAFPAESVTAHGDDKAVLQTCK
jgi:hypothetical protein